MSVVEAIEAGTVIDGFTVGELVFAGGVARLYACSSPLVEGPLVMKVPRIGSSEPTEALIGFETECMILPALSTVHAPRFVASGPIDAMPYLVMERVPGVSLAASVPGEDGPYPDSLEVARLGAALARAASAVHRQDVIHLDIKPDNAIVRPSGEVTLLDFGFSHHAHFPDLFAEGSRTAVGTWAYISPEQLDGARTDARSDQFAIGASLYELLTGRLPFDAPRSVVEARNRGWVLPPAPRALNPDIPPWLQEVVLRCLEPRPESRYASAAQLAEALSAPQSVELTARAHRLDTPGLFGQLRRYLNRSRAERPAATPPRRQIDAAPLILAAVDTDLDDPSLLDALADATGRALARSSSSRLACVTVVTDPPDDGNVSEQQREYYIRLGHWAQRFQLPDARQSLHVFQTDDPARAILEFARVNQVDAIVMGASHQPPGLKVWGRTVMTRVAEDAPCSVHIIRT